MHTVTIQDVIPAMSKEIVLASSCDAEAHKAKDLKFFPAEMTYRVRFHDGPMDTSKSFSYTSLQDAIDQYNDLDA